jgi:hypothetical protein
LITAKSTLSGAARRILAHGERLSRRRRRSALSGKSKRRNLRPQYQFIRGMSVNWQVGDLKAEAAALVRRIEAGKFLLGLSHDAPPQPQHGGGESVAALILAMLRRADGPLGLKDLRGQVRAAQGADWSAGQVNYFYTAVARLEKDGFVARDPQTKVVSLTEKGRDTTRE